MGAAPKSHIKEIILIAVAVVLVAAGVVWYFAFRQEEQASEEKAAESLERAVESAGAGTLPEINPLSNPLEKMPDVNPVNRANPFKDVKTNPFE